MIPAPKNKKVNKILEKIHLPHWLTILLFLILIFRIPSFFEPYAYGDEMIYLTLGEAIRQKVPLYLSIHDNKPPMIYLFAAIAGNLFWFKVILSAFCLSSVIIFYKLSSRFFAKNKKVVKFSTIILAVLTTIPLLEGNIVNAELMMLPFTLAAFWVATSPNVSYKHAFISGLLISFASLFKVPAFFDMGAIVFYWIITTKKNKKSINKLLVNGIVLVAGFAIPILISFLWALAGGFIREYVTAAFLQNIGYLSTWRPETVQISFWQKNLPLFIRFTVLIISLIILFLSKKKVSPGFLLAFAWLLFSLFSITLSERPYPHYLVQAIPSFSILFSLLVFDKTRLQSMAIFPLALALFIPVYYKYWYYPTTPYYQRFVEFASGRIDKNKYFESFGKEIPVNYRVTEILSGITTDKDRIFVWGDDAKIYALSRRLPSIKYTTNYHIKDFSSKEIVSEMLNLQKPKYIVLFPKTDSFPELEAILDEDYILLSIVEGVEIWKVISPEVKAAIAPLEL